MNSFRTTSAVSTAREITLPLALIKLYENRMAEYRTERDDNSGGITYWWSFNSDNVKKMMDKEADDELNEFDTMTVNSKSPGQLQINHNLPVKSM